MNVQTKILTSTAVAIAFTGGIGATLALADTPTPDPSPHATSSPSASATSSPSPGRQGTDRKKHKSLEARALHGDLTLGGKKNRVVAFQRGAVEQVSATSVTVQSKDGYTATYVLTAQTKVRKEKKAAPLSEVEKTDVIRIVAVRNGSTLTAKTIRDRG